MNNELIKQIKMSLCSIESLGFEKSCEILSKANSLLYQNETEGLGRELIIRLIDAKDKLHESTVTILNDLVESAGLHPYVNSKLLSGPACIRHEYMKSMVLEDIYFHEEQLILALNLNAGKSVIVSAPTSFGKSLLIEEVVAQLKYNNIVIIQPTLALLDETRKKLQKYRDDYNIIVNTSQISEENRRNLFLFTGERVVEYKGFKNIDFFVLDEFYKLSMERDDERAATLNHALYKLLKMTNKFYLLGPNINSISAEFVDKYKAIWFPTDFATVAVDLSVVLNPNKKYKVFEKEQELYKLLLMQEDPTIIYCSSPAKANKLSASFLEYIESGLQNSEISNSDLIEWIEENIHEGWILCKELSNSIGVHHGGLPRHLASSIVDAFNSGNIKYLFCTSTLIEGVNTAAKNVILFDKKKGPKTIDYFDFKNIVGRSGRMKRHYIGRVYRFHPDPKQENVNVDIPLITQDKAPDELLIQLDKDDIKPNIKEKMDRYYNLPLELQELLKRNVGIPIEGQLKVIEELNMIIEKNYSIFSWTGVPNYYQLSGVLELCYKYLFKKGESNGGVFTHNQLAVIAIQYYQFKSLKSLINLSMKNDYWIRNEPDKFVRLQRIINYVLQASKHWFDYKLPKFLIVMSELQEYVCLNKGLKPGNYSFFVKQFENNFLPSNLSILYEYGIPLSAIQKIEKLLSSELSFADVLNKLKTMNFNELELSNYEISKIKVLID